MSSKEFKWERNNQAWEYVTNQVESVVRRNATLGIIEQRLMQYSGIRMIDVLDHVSIVDTEKETLKQVGYSKSDDHYHCEGFLLPPVMLGMPCVAMRVDSIPAFFESMRLPFERFDKTNTFFRTKQISNDNGCAFSVVERERRNVFAGNQDESVDLESKESCLEQWRSRARTAKNEKDLYTELISLAKRQVSKVGQTMAAHLFFQAEREYWQSKNRAAQVMHAQLIRCGVGWSAHDHHTFRSSRRNFCLLLQFLQLLGFKPREKFFAGKEAGWGAQVMENSAIGIALFCDVDLEEQELDIDFFNEPLTDKTELGSVGLWCALHGDSLFAAGLHHVAINCDFDAIGKVLADKGVERMAPFSTLAYLQQAFTKGEVWPIGPDKVRGLVTAGSITQKEADRFVKEGAIGSHLETIQRMDGYKGFSQSEVSDIIQRTDPRKQ